MEGSKRGILKLTGATELPATSSLKAVVEGAVGRRKTVTQEKTQAKEEAQGQVCSFPASAWGCYLPSVPRTPSFRVPRGQPPAAQDD